MKKDTGLVRVYAVPGGHVPEVPQADQDVEPAEAKRLLAFGGPGNPQFTAERMTPKQLNALRLEALEPEALEVPPPSPPGEEAEQPKGPVEETGPSDFQEE